MSIIFGPVPSRRFGISLGIDLSPNLKQCNFDCLYCELKGAKTVSEYEYIVSVSAIIESIQSFMAKNITVDVLTITANGEPTLHPKLYEIILNLNQIKSTTKTLILSNGSTIYRPEIAKALCEFDIVKLSLDCVSEKCFKKLDRNDKSVDVAKIVEGMVNFRKIYKKEFIIEVLFVSGLNDNEEEIQLIYEALKKISPTRVDIGTIDRPPAYDSKPISFQKLEEIANYFEGLSVYIAYKNRPKILATYDEEQILALLERRPLCEEDIENIMNEDSRNNLEKLISKKKINIHFQGNMKFYKI